MSDQPTTPEPNDPDTPSRCGGRRPSSGSALLRMTVNAMATLEKQWDALDPKTHDHTNFTQAVEIVVRQVEIKEWALKRWGRSKYRRALIVQNENGEKPRTESAESTRDLKSGFSPPNC